MSDTATAELMASGRAARPEKVATVAEIAAKLGESQAVFVSEYRGLSVKQLADVRNALRPTGAEHVVYKNTLARIAVRDAGLDGLEDILVGPTAMTFVSGDIAAAAKALRDTSKTLPQLVIKGGVLGGAALSADDVLALADLPSREELLARIAGAFQAPLTKTAGLLSALPRKFAYGLQALIEKQAA
jgi:large subunit ribosomal protein L10